MYMNQTRDIQEETCCPPHRLWCLFIDLYSVDRHICRRHGIQSAPTHDDVIKWKHFPRHWPFVRGIHWSQVNSLHKGQWRGASMLSLIYAPINGWVNNGEAGDLRHHRDHYEVTAMHPWSVQRDSTINLYNSRPICAVDELCASLILHSVILVSLQENVFHNNW